MGAAQLAFAAPTGAANDNLPPSRIVDRWRCCIDSFKERGLTALAVYTAQCKLRGNETFDQFADRLLKLFEALEAADRWDAEHPVAAT